MDKRSIWILMFVALVLLIAILACANDPPSKVVGEVTSEVPSTVVGEVISTVFTGDRLTEGPTFRLQQAKTPVPISTQIKASIQSPIGVVIVSVRSANLRVGPGTNYLIVGNARQGDELPIYAKNEDSSWFQIDSVGQTWIAASIVELSQDVSTIPTATTPLPSTTTMGTSKLTDTPISGGHQVDLILDVPSILGKKVVEVEQIIGQTILITPNDDFDDILAGGEYRDYMIGKYWVFLSFDKNGIARGFQVLDGLSSENYSLADWKNLLLRFGLDIIVPPNRTAPAAIFWDNYRGFGIAVVASGTSGGLVRTVQIEDAKVFGR